RGDESDADEAFVRELGQSLDIPIVTESVDVAGYAKANKQSIETAGRVLRQQALAAMAAALDCRRIATAHHADDQAETMIHRLMRGTGFRGLCGIKPFSIIDSTLYIRPMLNLRRAEIVQYCNDCNIQWRQDKSNADLRFTRNRIRHQLLPALATSMGIAHPTGLIDSLVKLSVASQYLQKRVDEVSKDIANEVCFGQEGAAVSFDRQKLDTCTPWTFYEAIRQAVILTGAGLRDYSKTHFDKIRQMMEQPKAKADFPGGIEVIVEESTVIFRRKGGRSAEAETDGCALVLPDTVAEFGSWEISCRCFKADKADIDQFLKTKDAFIEWFDSDKVVAPVIAHAKEAGDRFTPIGTKTAKKVARFLQDGQFDAKTRQNAFVIADAEKILWVAPVRMCEQAKITSKTTEIIEISIEKAADR
ncbi:MAG: tRNA lysidine(34) synthetase TilS, partial [Planctomycetota bacterium]